jgi:hypothetical protein
MSAAPEQTFGFRYCELFAERGASWQVIEAARTRHDRLYTLFKPGLASRDWPFQSRLWEGGTAQSVAPPHNPVSYPTR